MSDGMIVVKGLAVRYGRTCVLEDINFSVERGAVYALLGRNGAGKSSLIRCILGQQHPAIGTVEVLARDAWRERTALMTFVGVVPEEPVAPPEMNARELGAFCRSIYPRWDGRSYEGRLEQFRVPGRLPFGQLSKGQKRQVSLALALAHDPELLILDDPTLGLDAVARAELFDELIGELADRGTTVLMTTHDLAGVEGIATHMAILHGTRLVLDEDVETVKSRFRRIRRAGASSDISPVLESIAGRVVGSGYESIVTNWDDAEAGSWAESGEPNEVTAMSLEDIFLAITRTREEER